MGISTYLGTGALLPGGLGFRNAIINGDFSVNQRGFTSTTSNDYAFDRWMKSATGGTTTQAAVDFALGNVIPEQEARRFLQVTVSGQSAPMHFCQMQQRIEGVRTFAGQAVTVSFYARATSGTPRVAVEFGQLFGTGGSPSANVFSYVGQATLSTTWQRFTFSAIVPSIAGRTIGTDNNDSLALILWQSAGNNFATRTGSLGIQNATTEYWGVQVEGNYGPTPFERRPPAVEMELCQRYYLEMGSTQLNGSFYATTASMVFGYFPVQMRAVPQVTLPPAPWTNALLDYGVAFRTPSNVQVNAITARSLVVVAFNGFAATYTPTTWYGGAFLCSAELL